MTTTSPPHERFEHRHVLHPLPTRELFGLNFVDSRSLDPVIDTILDRSLSDSDGATLPVVVTPNVDILVQLDRDTSSASAEVVRGAAMILPDGQPIVWSSRWLGEPLSSRLTGSSLVHELWPRITADRRRTVVIAGSTEIAERIEMDTPAARAVVAPRIGLDDRAQLDAFLDSCAELIADTEPELVFVALGFSKYHVMADLIDRLGPDGHVPIYLGVGAAFEMHYGLVRRAPRWVQRAGMEWFFRFLQEPRRLFRRYFIDDPTFARLVWRERRRRAVQLQHAHG